MKLVVCMADSFGDQAKVKPRWKTACKNPDINLVYTINEPAAAGLTKPYSHANNIWSSSQFDGGCAKSVKDVALSKRKIAAASQQYP